MSNITQENKEISLKGGHKKKTNDPFAKIIGYKDVKIELDRIRDILSNPEKYSRLGVTIPNGLLLYGEPGVGKTLMANSLITAVNRRVFVCRKDKPDGHFITSITKIFEQASQNTPSIVFLDDMDKFANDDMHHRNSDEYVTIQSCIDQFKGKDIFVLATANDLHHLPPSLLRMGRFDKILEIKNPRDEDAEAIVKHYLSQKNYVNDIDSKEIANILDGRSCAELETVINEAGIFAGYQNKEKIEMDDVIKACMRVIYEAPECASEVSPAHVKAVAYHEAGHAVIAEVLEPNSVNIVSVGKHDSSIGGITSSKQDKDYWTNIKYMENRVISLLGGRASTDINFGEIDIGSESDIDRAYNIVSRFLRDYASMGFTMFEPQRRSSDKFFEKTEEAIALCLEEYYQTAKQILSKNKDFLDKIATNLIEKKFLLRKDIQKIKSECKITQ